ncbi:MAG: hypothetical protein JXB10_02910 [Pirellulales bacterium]|nr:hypothetical protein [Pirellulales bacterium]
MIASKPVQKIVGQVANLSYIRTVTVGLCLILAAESARGNGGPFVVKYPNGDPAAKGVLARLDPTLKPARETRLRVVKEDLGLQFLTERNVHFRTDTISEDTQPSKPLVSVTAAYTIENPTDQVVQVDFGFPILRGIYISPFSMGSPDVYIVVDNKHVRFTVISNSTIYGIIRQRARESIESGIAADAALARLVAAVRKASGIAPPAPVQTAQQAAKPSAPTAKWSELIPPNPAEYAPAREALRNYLVSAKKWNPRDAALLVEYACLDLGPMRSYPRDRWYYSWPHGGNSEELLHGNLGVLSAIGEQKATQLFAQLAGRFDKDAAAAYEQIFTAWGGDVRERSIDLSSGQIRPRELETKKADKETKGSRPDPTVYARVDYLDPNAKLSVTEKASCLAVLKNLPVVFTFAPMNLLHYQVKFSPKQTRSVKVTYNQYAYLDTGGTPSYQLAYVLHPAGLWNDFGPIDLTIDAPKEVSCRASVPLSQTSEIPPDKSADSKKKPLYYGVQEPDVPLLRFESRLMDQTDKQGELFVAVDKAQWDAFSKVQMEKLQKKLKKEREEAEAAKKKAETQQQAVQR